MRRFLIGVIVSILLMGALHISGQAYAQQLPSGAIASIQQQFGGRVVGVNPSGGDNIQVQVLQPNGSIVIVMVSASTGAILGVSR